MVEGGGGVKFKFRLGRLPLHFCRLGHVTNLSSGSLHAYLNAYRQRGLLEMPFPAVIFVKHNPNLYASPRCDRLSEARRFKDHFGRTHGFALITISVAIIIIGFQSGVGQEEASPIAKITIRSADPRIVSFVELRSGVRVEIFSGILFRWTRTMRPKQLFLILL